MGGKAFANHNPPLQTPRMPGSVYHEVKRRVEHRLSKAFSVVRFPIEGPAKKDFGDVDVFVTGPRFQSQGDEYTKREYLDHISAVLGATAVIEDAGVQEPSAHFAIPWPRDLEHLSDSPNPQEPTYARRLHIQVDVQVFDSSSRLHYMLFHHAHGDIWQLLGNVIKPYGLTVDDKGLWLRIPEIEDADRKRSKVWLTGDPDEILDFLGLPYTRYWTGPFRDLYQMYEYVANCITFWVPPADETESALRANDRRRMKQRPAYREWVEEFKPLCRAQGRFSGEPMTRDQVRGRAFVRFNVRQTYMTECRAFLVEDQKRHILKTIIERIVPLPAEGAAKEDFLYRTVLVRALKEIVLDWNRGLYSIMAPGNLRDDEGFYHLGRTESFVLEYKDRIGKEAMDLHHRRMREKRAHEQPSRV
ncbi:hypothetical protein B0J15DRAFT_454205 [Fusarium solani]|uniref:Uncharacterized protein n=1 Tax=Fusarium solani TaxID=169388 RepID=A0A9P9GAA9_FUSSL|nr:uncharacterized protein B0J15DRAFT_454205 [Fusarium solani]KAH7235221.1 hypothetical protein B0J15DRAFT_454205 [Fusarium solani]